MNKKNMFYPQLLQTKRLFLTELRETDLPELTNLHENSIVRKYLGGAVGSEKTKKSLLQLLDSADLQFQWGVRLTPDGSLIGNVILSPHHDGEEWEISYLFNPKFWGQGFAQESVTEVVNHAFKQLGFSRLLAETQSANRASCNLLEKLGFNLVKEIERFNAKQAIYEVNSSTLNPSR
jgi:ribosomal-protein-alanine N-acetyltransferase